MTKNDTADIPDDSVLTADELATDGCNVAILLFVETLIKIAWEPFIFYHMWNWFVAPLGLKGLSYFHAMGLMLMIWIIKTGAAKTASEFKLKFVTERLCLYILLSSGCFFLAWLLHFKV